MSKPFVLAIVFFCASLGAQEPHKGFVVETFGKESFASHAKYPEMRLPLRLSGAGGPLITKWRRAPFGKSLFVLEYIAGEVGTSEKVLVLRSMVVDVKHSNILADEVSAYVDPQDRSVKLGPQPQWTWTPKTLLINKAGLKTPQQIKLSP